MGVGQQMGAALNPQQAAMQQQQQMLMNQMMMQMMGQQGAQPGTAPQAAAPAVPQTAAEIRAYLDQLDIKLASGEISEATYEKLSTKWEARLKELGE
jgi:hypothetical protein